MNQAPDAKGAGQVVVLFGTTGNRMTSIGATDKPFRIEAVGTVRPWRGPRTV
ncbi:hypothetical protein GHK69_24670 [Sinorhizobium meliloti]|nr:hypothetical protein [Sinorhizobium meliloti]